MCVLSNQLENEIFGSAVNLVGGMLCEEKQLQKLIQRFALKFPDCN